MSNKVIPKEIRKGVDKMSDKAIVNKNKDYYIYR